MKSIIIIILIETKYVKNAVNSWQF